MQSEVLMFTQRAWICDGNVHVCVICISVRSVLMICLLWMLSAEHQHVYTAQLQACQHIQRNAQVFATFFLFFFTICHITITNVNVFNLVFVKGKESTIFLQI